MLLDIPPVMQETDSDCGPAAFRAVVKFWGVRGAVVPAHCERNGCSPDALEVALSLAGLTTVSGFLDVPALKYLTGRGWPVICLVTLDGTGHYVVVRGVQYRVVPLHCPSRGAARHPAVEFESLWADVSRFGAVYDQWGVAVRRPS